MKYLGLGDLGDLALLLDSLKEQNWWVKDTTTLKEIQDYIDYVFDDYADQ